MILLLLEGQPGAGKTTYSEMIAGYLSGKSVPYTYADETTQDNVIFGDYWELALPDWKQVAEGFFRSWERYLDGHMGQRCVHIFDNSLLNQVQYLMIINAPRDAVEEFFQRVCGLLSRIEAAMILLEGDPETLTKRIIQQRTNGWGDRVSKLLERFPYQRDRRRTGIQGMIEFFKDARALKEQLLAHWPFKIARCEAMTGECRTRVLETIESLGLLVQKGDTITKS